MHVLFTKTFWMMVAETRLSPHTPTTKENSRKQLKQMSRGPVIEKGNFRRKIDHFKGQKRQDE